MMNTTRAALASPRPRPARIDVRCGSRPGSFDVATQLVTCKCSACRSSSRNDPYTPPEFEAHAGKSSSKKWKVTIKILMSNSNSNSNSTLGAWLDEHRIEARTFSGKVATRPSSPPPSVTPSVPPAAPQQHLPPLNLPPHLVAAAYYHAQAQEAQAAAARNVPAPKPSPHTPARQRLVPPTSAPPPPRKDKERAADGRPPTRRRIDVSLPSELSPRAEQINIALRAGNSPKVTGWRLTDTDRLSISMEIGSVTFSGTIDESPQLLASAVEVERLEHVPLPTEAVVFVAGNERMIIPHAFFNEDEIAWAMYRLGRHSTWMRRYSTWILTQRDNV